MVVPQLRLLRLLEVVVEEEELLLVELELIDFELGADFS